jgi:hypothetical protein
VLVGFIRQCAGGDRRQAVRFVLDALVILMLTANEDDRLWCSERLHSIADDLVPTGWRCPLDCSAFLRTVNEMATPH